MELDRDGLVLPPRLEVALIRSSTASSNLHVICLILISVDSQFDSDTEHQIQCFVVTDDDFSSLGASQC